jgi:hypothetical protein
MAAARAIRLVLPERRKKAKIRAGSGSFDMEREAY